MVPGGEISGSMERRIRCLKRSFYMQETQITNHQFVMFLNLVRDRVTIKEGAVSGEDGIWLLLGEISLV